MKTSKSLLTSVLKTAQMGQTGIRSVLPKAVQPGFRSALRSQLAEYDAIEQAARSLEHQRGWQLPELAPMLKTMSDWTVRARLSGHCDDSRIAGMMIQGNTRGMIKGFSDLHQYRMQDRAIGSLAEKLLDTETENIRQMQPYL